MKKTSNPFKALQDRLSNMMPGCVEKISKQDLLDASKEAPDSPKSIQHLTALIIPKTDSKWLFEHDPLSDGIIVTRIDNKTVLSYTTQERNL